MRVRVAHRPAVHPYVDHVALPEDQDRGHVKAVPVEDVFRVDALVGRVDVVHVHFGFEHLTARRLAAWASELRAQRIGLVYTVHDLDNPHLVDQRAHHDAVTALVGAADAVLTLTPWAAAELRRRTGVVAGVVPHPHVVPAGELRRRQGRAPPRRRNVYVHAASLRPNLDLELLGDIAGTAAGVDGVSVHVRRRHLDAAPADVRRRIEHLASLDAVDVDIGPRLDDDELWGRIASSRVVLLPYRWGTHSGLLEAARDLGTPVVAPSRGGFGDQGATTFDGPRSCLRALADARDPLPAPDRMSQRRDLAARHFACYRRVADRVVWAA